MGAKGRCNVPTLALSRALIVGGTMVFLAATAAAQTGQNPTSAQPLMKPLLLAELLLALIVFVALPLLAWRMGNGRTVELRGLNLPRSSVRSMLALFIVGSTVNFFLFGSAAVDAAVFDQIMTGLGTLSGAVVGFYFGGRTAAPPPENDDSDKGSTIPKQNASELVSGITAENRHGEVGPVTGDREG